MIYFLDYWLNALIYFVIPVLSVAFMFFVKRRLLWTAPLISTALAFITCLMIFSLSGITLTSLFSNGEWRAFFLLAMLIQLGIVIMLTAIAYVAAYILKRKK